MSDLTNAVVIDDLNGHYKITYAHYFEMVNEIKRLTAAVAERMAQAHMETETHKWVPKKSTHEMRMEGFDAWANARGISHSPYKAMECWNAMVAAAPPSTVTEADELEKTILWLRNHHDVHYIDQSNLKSRSLDRIELGKNPSYIIYHISKPGKHD